MGLVTDKKNTTTNKSRAEQEPRSAHGRAVNKSRVKREPRSAHGRAVKKKNNNNNKSRVKQEPRSAHGRAVNKSRVKQEPRSAHGRAVKKKNNNNNNKSRVKQEPRSAHGRAVNYSLDIKLGLCLVHTFTFVTSLLEKACIFCRAKLSNQPNNIGDKHGNFVKLSPTPPAYTLYELSM